SHTVIRRLARSFSLSLATLLPDGMRTRIHDGLRSTGASANCTGDRAILSPATWRAPGSRVVIGMALLVGAFMPPLSHRRPAAAGRVGAQARAAAPVSPLPGPRGRPGRPWTRPASRRNRTG